MVFWVWLVVTVLFVAVFVYYLRPEFLLSGDAIRTYAVIAATFYLLRQQSKAQDVGSTAEVFGPDLHPEERVPLLTGLGRLLVGIGVVLPQLFFLVWGLAQLAAVYAQINSLWHLPGFVTLMISGALSYVPLVGSIVGFFGAKDVWGWQWWQAALLYFGLPLFFIVVAIVISSVSAASERLGSRRLAR